MTVQANAPSRPTSQSELLIAGGALALLGACGMAIGEK
jgi:hypothetical protein